MTKMTFLSDNKTESGACLAEWGLSVLIETGTKKILFDTGQSDLFARNAKKLHVDLTDVDFAVISHGHYDHTNGVPAFARIAPQAPIYIHKNAFAKFYGTTDGEIDDYNCGILWTDEEKAALEGHLSLTDGPVWITPDIVISGTIPDAPELRPIEQFYRLRPDGSLTPDDMSHEQFLAIRDPEKGILLFSGCSHKGILAAIRYAKALFPGEKIACILAGMHLIAASPADRLATIEAVKAEDPELVIPLHCTGMEAIAQLKGALGGRCLLACVGTVCEL